MRTPSNPFIISGYLNPDYFCDRERALAWLQDQFKNERNSVLYSWRRMGKTALVRHFFYHLENEKLADPVFVDLLGTVNLEEANKRIAAAIVNRFGDLDKGIGSKLMKLLGSIGATLEVDPASGMPQITFALSKIQSVPSSMESIGSFLSERKKPVVICADEFQQVVNYPEQNAEAIFRTWTQDFPMLRFIFCGSQRHMMISMFSEASRPFYRSAQLLQLDPLPGEVYREFIQSFFRKTGNTIRDSHIENVFKWTRMQTYYVQLVFNKLFGKNEVIDDNLVDEVYGEMIQQEIPIFSSYQHLFTAFQWKLLMAIAKAENVESPMSQNFLRKYDLGAASSVSTALQTLIQKEFVIYHDQKYTLHDTLLMRWLQLL